MDWITWFSNALSSLAWPGLILIVILIFHTKIRDLIDRIISIDIAGLKAQLSEITQVQKLILDKNAESTPLVENLSKVTKTINDEDGISITNYTQILESLKPSVDQLVKVETEKNNLQSRLVELSEELESRSFNLGKFHFGSQIPARQLENKMLVRKLVKHFGIDAVIFWHYDDLSKSVSSLIQNIRENGKSPPWLSKDDFDSLKYGGLLDDNYVITSEGVALFKSVANQMKRELKDQSGRIPPIGPNDY